MFIEWKQVQLFYDFPVTLPYDYQFNGLQDHKATIAGKKSKMTWKGKNQGIDSFF